MIAATGAHLRSTHKTKPGRRGTAGLRGWLGAGEGRRVQAIAPAALSALSGIAAMTKAKLKAVASVAAKVQASARWAPPDEVRLA